ncbi:ABC transporter ATP-binding protein [Marinisporobacter balticus]|nr:ATP-binding cassette domain-containing protein [Marinisporobacter balticus]
MIGQLTKKYKDHLILDNITIQLKAGGFYGFKGSNGAGKSTLFRIIAGLERPTCGTVTYDGEKLNSTILKRITYMHQKPYMMKTSVEENILYPLKIRGLGYEIYRQKVKDIMFELDLYKLRTQLATQLSGGEMQKVALARALIFEPEILLMDEPTAHVDKQTVQAIETMLLKRKCQDHMMTAVITHDEDQLVNLFEQVIQVENHCVFYV